MSEPTDHVTGTTETRVNESRFQAIRDANVSGGASAALDRLAETLEAERRYGELFDVLLMRKRREVGYPLRGDEVLKDFPPELQGEIESYYIDCCRKVGGLHLADGDIAGAWSYFDAIEDRETISRAIDTWSPRDGAVASTVIDAVIDIAFRQGAHPVRGFRLILEHQGTCRAVSALEHEFPHPAPVRETCAGLLIEQVHRELLEAIRAALSARGEEVTDDERLPELVDRHPSLVEDGSALVDSSHLEAAVRAARDVPAPETVDLALELCEYGRRLRRDHYHDPRDPFDDFHGDHRIWLKAARGEGVDGAIRYFRQRAERAGPGAEGSHPRGEVLVALLARCGRSAEAASAYLEFLSDVEPPLEIAPSLEEICEAAGDFRPLTELAERRGDLLLFTTSLVRHADAAGEGGTGEEGPAR